MGTSSRREKSLQSENPNPAKIPAVVQNEALSFAPARLPIVDHCAPPDAIHPEAKAWTSAERPAPTREDPKQVPHPEPVITALVPYVDPFAGFTGHCFLHLCQFFELATGWKRDRSARAPIPTESLFKAPAHSWLKYWGSCSLGTICCTVIAAALIPLFNASSIKSFLPLPFLVIIVLVAFRFGRAAGVLGTIAAAFLFADFLFEPAGLAISDPSAKNHLIWMLVIGIVISDLLGRFKLHRQNQKF
jgi:Domain of unknown function (DUF4118)